MNRKLCVLTAMLLYSVSIYAAVWRVEGGAAAHKSSTEGLVAESSVAGGYGEFYFGLMAGGKEYLGIDAAWDHEGKDSFRSSVGTSVSHHYGSGGLWTAYADAGQDFLIWDWLDFRYRAGVQMGLSWADGMSMCPFSLSPYAFWLVGYKGSVFSIGAYGASMRRFEHTYQAPPVLGVEMGFDIDGSSRVELDSWMKLSDYMDGADLIITDTCVRLTYIYRGGKA